MHHAAVICVQNINFAFLMLYEYVDMQSASVVYLDMLQTPFNINYWLDELQKSASSILNLKTGALPPAVSQ